MAEEVVDPVGPPFIFGRTPGPDFQEAACQRAKIANCPYLLVILVEQLSLAHQGIASDKFIVDVGRSWSSRV
jgi:hypothetical protein